MPPIQIDAEQPSTEVKELYTPHHKYEVSFGFAGTPSLGYTHVVESGVE